MRTTVLTTISLFVPVVWRQDDPDECASESALGSRKSKKRRRGIGRGMRRRRSDHRQCACPEKIRRRARNALSRRRPVSIWARNPIGVMSARPGPRFERSVVIRALASGDCPVFVTDLLAHWRRSKGCPHDRGNHHRRQNGAGQRLIVVHTPPVQPCCSSFRISCRRARQKSRYNSLMKSHMTESPLVQ